MRLDESYIISPQKEAEVVSGLKSKWENKRKQKLETRMCRVWNQFYVLVGKPGYRQQLEVILKTIGTIGYFEN